MANIRADSVAHGSTISARIFEVALLALATAFCIILPSARGQFDAEPRTTMDQAIALLDQARLSFRSVRDCEYRSVNRERVNGKLQPETIMLTSVRTKPFSVYLRCESPENDKGLEVCYVEGRNDGMMRVHPAGVKGVLGFWSIDIHDPRVLEKNRHFITEAGPGNLLESTARYWEIERRLQKTRVRISDEQTAGRDCTRIDTIHPDRTAGDFYGYHCILWLDKATHLPIGAETYDWPCPGGPAGGDLVESYRYWGVRYNVGLDDETFRH